MAAKPTTESLSYDPVAKRVRVNARPGATFAFASRSSFEDFLSAEPHWVSWRLR